MTIRIGNAAGFLGDNIDAPRRLVETTELDYLTLEYLAELTLSILARSREKDPAKGYATDFLEVMASLTSSLKNQSKLKVVTNAGGVNPTSCTRQIAQILCDAGLNELPIGMVSGDDLLPQIAQLQADGYLFENLDTGEALSELSQTIVSANAYLGASGIVNAIENQARIVITGRVADASLTVGPAIAEFGWQTDDWNRQAAATVAGHLIECGAQVTGGYSASWQDYNLAEVGYPIAELQNDGEILITKPKGTGGRVDRQTVVEQLVYEIGDPGHYLTPDVVADFTSVTIDDLGNDEVRVSGATGTTAPSDYKVSIAYHNGYTASGTLLVLGRDAVTKARVCGEMILAKVKQAGYQLDATNIECLGAGDSVPGIAMSQESEKELREVMLRVSVQDSRREAVERFTKELAPLITSGPSGLAGYATGRSAIRPVFAYWPTLIPKHLIDVQSEVRNAADWVK